MENKRQRNKEIQTFQLNHIKEKKEKEIKKKEKDKTINSDTEKMLKKKSEYMEYLLWWVDIYRKQGKDITPLMIEINIEEEII